MEYFFHLNRTQEGIAVFTIDRPPVNALNFDQFESLLNSIFAIIEDKNVKTVILTGRGKTFMAGFDINAIKRVNTPEACFKETMVVKDLFSKLEYLHKPVIAAINGDCLGGGLEIAMACHLRFASERARFGFPEINMATIPTLGGTQRSARLLGRAKAMELLLTGDLIDSKEALRVGLINGVFSDEGFEDTVRNVAGRISEKSLPSIQAAVNAVMRGMDKSLRDGMILESELSSELILTDDLKEGIAAFLERRKPIYRNQ